MLRRMLKIEGAQNLEQQNTKNLFFKKTNKTRMTMSSGLGLEEFRLDWKNK